MTYTSRIPVEPSYLEAVGRAFYNFVYLEWVVVWTIVKLNSNGFGSVPKGKSASYIAKALIKAINTTVPPLPKFLRIKLVKFHESYGLAIKTRNKLLHAHPYTAQGGLQRLRSGPMDWPVEAVYDAARQFEDAAIAGNSLFHGELNKVRP